MGSSGLLEHGCIGVEHGRCRQKANDDDDGKLSDAGSRALPLETGISIKRTLHTAKDFKKL